MNNNMGMDLDPLSNYDYAMYNYHNVHPENPLYPYNMKLELPKPEFYNNGLNYLINNGNCSSGNTNNDAAANIPEYSNQANIDTKDATYGPEGTAEDVKDIKPVIFNKKVKKEKKNGQRSSYWSEKITDSNFAFYGCSVCNVNYQTLNELDQHVTIHKDRLTSYDLRIKNKIKRKKLKKDKKAKKNTVVKTELEFEVEIKPEDGYIGNKKASDFNESNCTKLEDNSTENKSSVNNENEAVNNGNSSQTNENSSNKKSAADVLAAHNLEKIYKCFACLKQFSLSYYLKLHVRSHTDEKPYTCPLCGQSFITASKLGRHNKRIHLSVRHQCRICHMIFSRFELLTRHFDKRHPEDKIEGEPYDYNAILPYLKELEEQLKQKDEIKEKKPKEEELWGDLWPLDQPAIEAHFTTEEKKDVEEQLPPPEENRITYEFHNNVEIEKLDAKIEVEIKKEEEDTGIPEEIPEDVKEESFMDDSYSSDDYFPSNTWASTPKITSPSSPTRLKKNGDDPLQCDICNKKISSLSYMRIHMRTHTGERPFKCYICGRGFITSSKMHRHVLTHSESWEEDKKPENVKIEPDAEGDVSVDKKSKIKKAKEKFTKSKKNGEKPSKKYQKRPHMCEFCHKRFLHIETLQVHKKSHEGEELSLKCNFCLSSLDTQEALKEHEATHTGPKPYLCTICGKTYKKKETMVYHKKHHKPDREFSCEICSKRFNAQCKLQRHIVSHRTDKFILKYECPVCAHMFNTKYHIQMHLTTHQKEGLIMEENRNEILAMVLQNARKIPKQPDAPASLTNLIPSDERSRVCNICGEVFQHFYYLEEHLKSHGSKIAIEDIDKVEEKKYVCPICNKSFKLHYYLKLHSFTHSKEKPFICQQCGKGFITKGKLKRHLETHTGLKKFQCHICYKFFTRPSYLRIHIRTIHGTQDYNFRLEKGYGAGSLSSMSVMSQDSI